jgi:hypothetical protein
LVLDAFGGKIESETRMLFVRALEYLHIKKRQVNFIIELDHS